MSMHMEFDYIFTNVRAWLLEEVWAFEEKKRKTESSYHIDITMRSQIVYTWTKTEMPD